MSLLVKTFSDSSRLRLLHSGELERLAIVPAGWRRGVGGQISRSSLVEGSTQ